MQLLSSSFHTTLSTNMSGNIAATHRHTPVQINTDCTAGTRIHWRRHGIDTCFSAFFAHNENDKINNKNSFIRYSFLLVFCLVVFFSLLCLLCCCCICIWEQDIWPTNWICYNEPGFVKDTLILFCFFCEKKLKKFYDKNFKLKLNPMLLNVLNSSSLSILKLF